MPAKFPPKWMHCLLVTMAFLLASSGSADSVRGETAAERGYRLLRTKPYLSREMSRDVFAEVWEVWPTPHREKAATATSEERRRMAFARYGMHELPAFGQLALGHVEDENGLWAMNCLGCHGGKVAGRPIPGLGNSHIALQTLSEDLVRHRQRKGENVGRQLATLLLTPFGKSNGTTNAQVFSIAFVMMRDQDLNFVPPRGMPTFLHHDLDAPPLWNTHKKKRLYIDGFVEKTPRVIMQFVLEPENKAATIKGWEGDFRDILAWIESLRPPAYPWPIDRTLAASGEVAFNRSCARCHGTHGPQGKYPEKRIPIEEIGTDPRRLEGMSAEHRRFFQKGWMGENGKRTVVEKPDGYVAPPLDGVWASAPYLHNGSVPTLWHLFHSDRRPVVWLRTEDGYDQRKVGLEVTEYKETPKSATPSSEARRYFNTKIPGKSAGGHLFPDELTEDEKNAVIEYLKTI